MSKLFEKYPAVKIVLFIISWVGAYGGVVNYGGFDLLPAIPFFVFVIYVALKWRKAYLAMTVVLFIVCNVLYILKKQHGPLFHPPLGQEFTFKQDMCLHKYDGFVLPAEISDKLPCVNDGSMGGLLAVQILPANTPLKISKISVSNADMGETYVIHAPTPFGEIYLSGNRDNLAVWANGEVIQQKDLRRAIFYLPSLMMYWPVLPLIFLNR